MSPSTRVISSELPPAGPSLQESIPATLTTNEPKRGPRAPIDFSPLRTTTNHHPRARIRPPVVADESTLESPTSDTTSQALIDPHHIESPRPAFVRHDSDRQQLSYAEDSHDSLRDNHQAQQQP
ncbi:hypothetical protein Droror1_Dr00024518 [Drosera rotundifolia]